MDFRLSAEQLQLERDIHAYLRRHVTAEVREEIDANPHGGGPLQKQLVRQMGRDGWLGMGWPQEYGGQGRTPIEQYIFFDTALGYYGIHLPLLALNTVGPTIMRVGSEAQKRQFLPRILSGDLEIAIGYTEPEAGTDLASLKSTAIREGDDFIINGQKVFTTSAHEAGYIWLAARTDPTASKHRGISIFIVDRTTPGITVRPTWIMGGFRTNSTFYDNIRVSRDCMVGEENQGWRYMTTQLGLERIMLVPHSATRGYIHGVVGWAKEHSWDGQAVIEQPWVRDKVIEMSVATDVLRLFNYRLAWQLTYGTLPRHESAMIKVFGTELTCRVLGNCLEIMGRYGQLQSGSKWAALGGRLTGRFQSKVINLFGGGANDALREVIATTGLGFPRST